MARVKIDNKWEPGFEKTVKPKHKPKKKKPVKTPEGEYMPMHATSSNMRRTLRGTRK